MKSSWTTKNANSKLNDILNLQDTERIKEANEIRQNLKEWAKENFRLTANQEKCRQVLPPEYWEETGYMLARAIEKKYPIELTVSEGDMPPNEITRNDGGEVGWSEKSGFHAKYTFKF